ncbi:polyhydroxyalkanoate synthesis protein PhaF [bacterium]|jgi:polyhydroxyalkanoate synthesis regulator phasin|nr:polyhydroxyalkanoate synthesis protein PhaF [bacterium]MDC3376821.1 hypothetical protein [Candidatus Nanopelagicales bacterium]
MSMLDGLRGYVQLASGLTEVTASKARDAAMALVNQGMQLTGKTPDVMDSVQDIADDLLTTSKQNRELLVGIVRTEVDKAVGRMGFVREDELAALRARVEHLEKAQQAGPSSPTPSDETASAPESAAGAAKPVKVKKKVVPE